MMIAFRGKHWTSIPISVLSHHREIIIALSGLGYHAYLPAYLMACLANDETYGADMRGYVLYGLRPLSSSEVHVNTARERLSLLDDKQRRAVAKVLRYLEDRWRMAKAGEILRRVGCRDAHTAVVIADTDRAGLERLCQYGARFAFAQDRLAWIDDGRISYRLKRPRFGFARSADASDSGDRRDRVHSTTHSIGSSIGP